jgi:hypothetical protein
MNLGFKKQLLLLLLVLGGALVIIFNTPAFMPNGNHAALPFFNSSQMLFNNDNPLGAQMAEQNRLPGTIFGLWGNLNWVGGEGVGESPRVSTLTAALLRPEMFTKYFPFLSVMFLGFCAWLYFRQLKFGAGVCVFAGLAAGVNMHFFSVAAWGLSQWNIAAGCVFLALAALTTDAIKQIWARAILAGFAVGILVMEGFDSGAILSMYIGVFILYSGLISKEPLPGRAIKTAISAGLVVLFSLFVSWYTVNNLIGTQIKGVVGAEKKMTNANSPEEKAKADQEWMRRWSFSTQWSLPKLETLRLFIPGLMGYHMYENVDGPDKSSAYWGRIGEDLRLTELQKKRSDPNPQVRAQAEEEMKTYNAGYRRHIGSGDYAGLLVMMLAIFAAANSWRGERSPYSWREKRVVWFWVGGALVSLILAYGRHSFAYQFVFELPYFSSTRNPIKFLHAFFVCVLILNAYGAEAIWRLYLQGKTARTDFLPQHLMSWWSRVSGFEKKWTIVSILVFAASVFGFFVLASKRADLEHFLSLSGVVAGTEKELAEFCVGEVFCYLVFLLLSIAAFTCVISGAWKGNQAKWAWIVMGVILVCDVGRANRYWLKYYNEKEKYALNPVLDFLRKEPYEKKSTAKLTPFGHYDISGCPAPRKQLDNNFYAVCNEWLQNQFPYYDIQALDIVQAPRTAEVDMAMAGAFQPTRSDELPLAARLWQLTNTRYIFCWAGFLTNSIYQGSPSLQGLDPSGNAFQVRARLNPVLAPGVTVPTTAADLSMEQSDTGDFLLVEYTNTLPRAKLYSNWQVADSDEVALATLKTLRFDPQQIVLVAKDTAVPAPVSPGADAGTVKIVDYHPKYIKLQANANTGTVLLLNDRISPNWQVTIDDKPGKVLRCNYFVRGVYVDKGQHTVVFKFRPPLGSLYVSLAGWGVGILVAGFVVVTNRRRSGQVVDPS